MTGKFKKATIVDVRTPEEFEDDHISNAINIPLDLVTKRIIEFKQMEKPIVAYCRSGNRSAIAVSLLTQNGIHEAINGGSLEEVRQILKT